METTNSLFQSEADVESTYSFTTDFLPRGHYILRHFTLDASAQPVGEILTAEFDIHRPLATLLRFF